MCYLIYVAKRKKVLKLKPKKENPGTEMASSSGITLSIPILVSSAIALITVSFLIGYIVHPEINNAFQSLRLSNKYKYVNPLLACDTELELESDKTRQLTSQIQDYVSEAKSRGELNDASVYVRDYNGGYVVNYNPEGRYNQASLSKVVVMMKVLELAEKDPGFLSKTFTYTDLEDYNLGLEILPTKALVSGQQYTIEEALRYMTEYSDNNATFYLMSILDQGSYDNIYHDLKISPPSDEQIENYLDFRTAKEYSYFFRVLYNATYLDREASEKAIEYLTRSDFDDGLEAGVPEGVTVAHKFGILNHLVDNKPERELHDCGIIYKDNSKPYLACIMTKSFSELGQQKKTIGDISALIFQELRQ